MRPVLVALALAHAAGGCAAPASQTRLSSANLPPDAATTAASVPSSAPPPDDRPVSDGEPPSKRSRNLRNAGWASIAVGGSAAVFAVASAIVMLHDASLRNSECNAAKECSTAGLSANSALANNAVTNVMLWSVAVSGLGIGTFFVLTNPNPRKDGTEKRGSTAIGVAPNGQGGSLILRGNF